VVALFLGGRVAFFWVPDVALDLFGGRDRIGSRVGYLSPRLYSSDGSLSPLLTRGLGHFGSLKGTDTIAWGAILRACRPTAINATTRCTSPRVSKGDTLCWSYVDLRRRCRTSIAVSAPRPSVQSSLGRSFDPTSNVPLLTRGLVHFVGIYIENRRRADAASVLKATDIIAYGGTLRTRRSTAAVPDGDEQTTRPKR